ncbi:MAG TPA: GAF domain-containing protein [Candidatus Sulfotelmatobacter sp.]|nr:GAF domain-containing protein [Candidatus Sulfotelmatobacter sp.]
MAKGTVSDPIKPVLDEQTLGKLLEAAFVIQEHSGELPKAPNQASLDPASPDQASQGQISRSQGAAGRVSASPLAASQSRAASEKSAPEKSAVAQPRGKDAFALTLAQIAETQQQILTHHLALENAMALVAQRAAEISKAGGCAIGIIEGKPDGKKLRYRAVSGLLTLERGSEVAMEKALCFTCLRSGEVIRCADMNADFLIDTEECRRRGIGSLIAIPIHGENGIAGAMEVYFAGPNAFSEQEVHSCQLMAGLVTEALAREAGASSRKSVAAERAAMLDALEKLRPNLAALMESPALKQSLTKSVTADVAASKAPVSAVAAPVSSAPLAEVPAAASVVADIAVAAIPKPTPAPTFLCRKCGHQLVGEEMFCGKCGSPRTSDYQPPTMQSKLASLWHKQQSSKSSAAPAPANGGLRSAEPRRTPDLPTEIQPWEAVLSELSDPFGDPEPEPKLETKTEKKPELRTEPPTKRKEKEKEKVVIEVPVLANIPPVEAYVDSDLEMTSPLETKEERKKEEEEAETETEETAPALAATALSTTADRLTWSSAAKAKQVLEQLAASKNQNSFARFWNARRGDVYLAVAVILVAAVIRWSIWSEHSVGANAAAAKQTHRRLAPEADLSTFDKLLISLGLAEPPDPPENKGNPETKVWVDLHSALYYCPGADLYGKTPQGKYSSQRDAQLGQFEPAYRKVCN